VSWLEHAKARNLIEVAQALGLQVRPGARGSMECPSCHELRRGRQDRRLPASVTRRRWHCWHCGIGGDVVDLVAVHLTGDRYSGQPEVRAWSGWGSLAVQVAPEASPEVSRVYPPIGEVRELLSACAPIHDDPEARRWMERRIGAGWRAVGGLGGALQPGRPLPGWAGSRRGTWVASGHRLILPVIDHRGRIRSVRARRITDADTSAPKSLPPRGYSVGGLVLACPSAARLLRGQHPSPSPRVVIAEGEVDWLAWASQARYAVFGIGSGWWTISHAVALPDGIDVLIATDLDEQGDRYAEAIADTLRGHARITRWRPSAIHSRRREDVDHAV